MGYDLIFVNRRPWQSWRRALERAEEFEETTGPDAESWERITEAARFLGNVSAETTDEYAQLTHEPTAITLVLHRHYAEISIPYGDTGATAITNVTNMYRLGLVVQQTTGLPGYDPQRRKSIKNAAKDPALALPYFEQVARLFR